MKAHLTPRETIEIMLRYLGVEFQIQEENRLMGPTLNIFTPQASRLIGPNGNVLEDIQYLLNGILSSTEEDESAKVIVDIDNYRRKQFDKIIEHAQIVAAQVRESGQEARLQPLNAFERRLVHNAFKDDPDIETISPEGDNRLKRIIVRKKQAASST
jgi:spoIIIJ-associated protein